jgi:hypothetical protein
MFGAKKGARLNRLPLVPLGIAVFCKSYSRNIGYVPSPARHHVLSNDRFGAVAAVSEIQDDFRYVPRLCENSQYWY